MCVCVCARSVSLRVCVHMCDFSRFLVEVTDLPKAGFELTTCRFGSVRVSRWGIGTAPRTIVTEKGVPARCTLDHYSNVFSLLHK